MTYDMRKDLLVLYIPKVDLRHAVWGGAGSTIAEAYAKYDVDIVEYTSELETDILKALNSPEVTSKVYLDDALLSCLTRHVGFNGVPRLGYC